MCRGLSEPKVPSSKVFMDEQKQARDTGIEM